MLNFTCLHTISRASQIVNSPSTHAHTHTMRLLPILVTVLPLLLLLASAAAGDDLAPPPPVGVADPQVVLFESLCGDDATSTIPAPGVRWETNPPARGSTLTFDICNPADVAPYVFARLMIHNRWTGETVADYVIQTEAAYSNNTNCLTYTAWTNLPVVAGKQLTSELRAVTSSSSIDNGLFLARRCIV